MKLLHSKPLSYFTTLSLLIIGCIGIFSIVHTFRTQVVSGFSHNQLQVLKEFQEDKTTYLRIDPNLGWSIRPNVPETTTFFSTHFASNSLGIRAEEEDNLTSKFVILLFGDSYVHGDEVKFRETWGYNLQKNLIDLDIPAVVLNYGVPAYGMDQAYLRYLQIAQNITADIVIIGLQEENINRNVNLLRSFYIRGTNFPLSKPRFILENNQLKLINYPIMPIEEILNAYVNTSTFLQRYDAYTPSGNNHEPYYYPNIEEEKNLLAVAILEKFSSEIVDHHGRPLVVVLPSKEVLTYALQHHTSYQTTLLLPDEIAKITFNPFAEYYPNLPLWWYRGHYPPEIHSHIAHKLVDYIQKLYEDNISINNLDTINLKKA